MTTMMTENLASKALLHSKLGIHIVQMTSLCECPRLVLYFEKYVFYVPNLCILGSRSVLPYKKGSCWKLELLHVLRAKGAFCLQYSCHLSVVGCSQVELSYQPICFVLVEPTVLEKPCLMYISLFCLFP